MNEAVVLNEWFSYALVLILPFVVVILGQAILNRMLVGRNPQLLTAMSMLFGYLPFFVILHQLTFPLTRDFGFYLFFFLYYSFAAYTYFHVFNMSETSRRVRLLTQVDKQARQGANQFEDIYDDAEMLKKRLDRLVTLGQIRSENGLYYPRARFFADVALTLYFLGWLLDRAWKPMKTFRDRL